MKSFLSVVIGIAIILFPVSTHPVEESIAKAAQETGARKVWVTAYSSTPNQTDDTPFITASGHTVRNGIVAANFLPFGTKVRIPKLFGDRVFTVDDRMHARKKNFVDIWMPTTQQAKNFGIHQTEIIVVES